MVLLAGAVVAVVVVVGCGGDDGPSAVDRTADRRAEQARELADEAGLGPEVREFLATAAAVSGTTYRVTYATEDVRRGDLVVTQLPPDRRIDISVDEGGERVTRSIFATEEGTFTCRRGSSGESAVGGTDEEIWFCATTSTEPAVPGAFAEGSLTATVDDLRSAAIDYELRVEDRELLGVAATCLLTVLKPGRESDPTLGPSGTLCVSDDGVPLLVDRPAGRLEATDLSRDVDPSLLELPAAPEPVDAASTTTPDG